MTLWLLSRIGDTQCNQRRAVIVRALTGASARRIATAEDTYNEDKGDFLDKSKVSCEVLQQHGPIGIIVTETREG
jgi:hypothetical protein